MFQKAILAHVTYDIKSVWLVLFDSQGTCFQGEVQTEETTWQESNSFLTSPD